MSTRGFAPGQVCDVAPDARLFNYPDGKAIGEIEGHELTRALLGYSPNGREYALVSTDLKPGRTAWVRASQVVNVRPATACPTASRRAARSALRKPRQRSWRSIDD